LTGESRDVPNEILMVETGLPMDEESFVQFRMLSKNDLYLDFDAAIFQEPGVHFDFRSWTFTRLPLISRSNWLPATTDPAANRSTPSSSCP